MASALGKALLLGAFLACSAAIACLVAAGVQKHSIGEPSSRAGRLRAYLVTGARWATHLECALLVSAMALLMGCFAVSDVSLLFVAENLSDGEGALAALIRVSGAWSGQQGSLMTWAVMLSAYSAFMARGSKDSPVRLDEVALLVTNVVVLAFTGACCFASVNDPFVPTPAYLLDESGRLSDVALALGLGMGEALKHWGLACHPPLLFAGYAGMTVPFAYAVAALVTGDCSARWAVSARRPALVSLACLTAGILLGSVWASDSAGWGGFWSWDAVENASLLPWLCCVGFLHSASFYDRDQAFGKQAVLFAALCFAFVLVGTFIARSGYVRSLHAYAGQAPAMLALPAFAAAVGVLTVVGLHVRRGSFEGHACELVGPGLSVMYVGNVITLTSCFILCFATCLPAMPEWLPFGGSSVSKVAFDALAVLLGLIAMASACCLLALSRRKAGPAALRRRPTSVLVIHLAVAVVILGFAPSRLASPPLSAYAVWLGGAALATGLIVRALRGRR